MKSRRNFKFQHYGFFAIVLTLSPFNLGSNNKFFSIDRLLPPQKNVNIEEGKGYYKQTFFNCGVNACIFILKKLKISFGYDEMEKSLKAGKNWQNENSLKEMGLFFLKKGLKVIPYGGIGGNDIYRKLLSNPNSIIVCHTVNGGIGHFYLAGFTKENHVLFVNPG